MLLHGFFISRVFLAILFTFNFIPKDQDLQKDMFPYLEIKISMRMNSFKRQLLHNCHEFVRLYVAMSTTNDR